MQPIKKRNIPEFKWLFTAYFADGTVIVQTQESEIGHSMMTDVTKKQKESKLISFKLHKIDSDNHVIVDLTDGNFIVNGTKLQAHNQYFEPSKYDLELVYFKERKESLNMTTGEADTWYSRYFIGWSTKVNKQTKQITLAVGG